jgi:hypothetical protein
MEKLLKKTHTTSSKCFKLGTASNQIGNLTAMREITLVWNSALGHQEHIIEWSITSQKRARRWYHIGQE